MREDIRPGDLVIVDQFIDRTVSRPRTFFDRGIVAHVGFSDPTSARIRTALQSACERLDLRHHVGGAYVCIEGPQFSTIAESHTFRTWPGVAVIGMTNLPEARLAREAELPYATLALATDYDCWNDDHDAVTVEQVIATLQANVAKAKQVVAAVAAQPPVGPDPAEDALRFAIMTNPAVVPAEARERLDLFLAKYWPR
jgi:5'-methylthioadenosine phosphorylase